MRKIFRKAITILGSAALIGSSIGMAAAASYPSPFTSNTAIVVGANAAPSDNIAASSIAANLDAASAGGSTIGIINGETASLASGSDYLYMNDELNENVQVLTKDNFPTVLADGTFTNDDGTAYDFEQTLTIGDSTSNRFAFTNSNNDLDDPALAIELSSSTANVIYNLTATFNKAVNLSASASEGEEITLFGKTYTVGTATDTDTLVLLGGASGAIINVGESTTMTVNGIKYDVALMGLSSAATTQASISVNGDTKTFTQGQTKSVGGVDVYVKTVFRTGDTGDGYAEIQLGADKLTLEHGSAVQTGTDNDDIDGTLVSFTPASGDQIGALTKITIGIVAEDSDSNHLLVGDSFVDPVFGTVLLNFDGVENGPTFSEEKDTGRNTMEIKKGGNRELLLGLTDNSGNTKTVPFTYNGALADDDGKSIHVIEGDSIADDEYFILNSGNNQHLMQMTKVDADSSGQVTFKDLLSGTSYGTSSGTNHTAAQTVYILGQAYTITRVSNTAVTVTSSDYSATNKYVFPYIELVSGEDTRVAFTDDVVAIVNFNCTASNAVTLELPTGSAVVDAAGVDTISVTATGGTTISALKIAENDSIKIGTAYYAFRVTDGTGTNITNITIAMDTDNDEVVNETYILTPGILFVEDDDKSESTTTTRNSIVVTTTDSGSGGYSTVSAPLFPGQTEDTGYSSETWDDTDFTGWLTNYGTYVWRDTGDTNQNFVGLSYGDDMMYADVSFAEGEAATAPEVGVVTVLDTNVASAAGKNLVVVGGSCINSVAAELLGVAYCESKFTDATSVGAGEFLIQSFSRAGKTALLVAGYNAADTEKATTYLLNNNVVTTTGTKYKGTSATQATVVVA